MLIVSCQSTYIYYVKNKKNTDEVYSILLNISNEYNKSISIRKLHNGYKINLENDDSEMQAYYFNKNGDLQDSIDSEIAKVCKYKKIKYLFFLLNKLDYTAVEISKNENCFFAYRSIFVNTQPQLTDEGIFFIIDKKKIFNNDPLLIKKINDTTAIYRYVITGG